MKRGLLIGGGLVVVVIVAAVVFLISNVDALIKAAIEEGGSRITGTQVTLREVEISTSGEGSLRGFRMGNPKGFKTPSAVELGEVSIKLNLSSVTGDVVLIREIVIAAPQITYELGAGGSNLDAIRKNVAAFTGGGTGDAGAAEDGGGTKMIIENLYIRGGKISVSATFLGGRKMTAALPDIHLKDIGKEKNGATPGEVADKLLASIADGAKGAVGALGIGKMMDKVGGAKEAVEKGLKGTGEAITKGVEGIGGAIKGLFGK